VNRGAACGRNMDPIRAILRPEDHDHGFAPESLNVSDTLMNQERPMPPRKTESNWHYSQLVLNCVS
jgi:hypothetical protein